MKKILLFIGRQLLSLKYKVTLKGVENFQQLEQESKEGILVLPNHPSELDPVILMAHVPSSVELRPLVLEDFFEVPWIRFILNLFKSISMPSFEEVGNPYKNHKTEKTFLDLAQALNKGDNLLIYPSGRLKRTGHEDLGAASAIPTILQNVQKPKIILVRTTGLWGSTYSTYCTGTRPDLTKNLLHDIKIILLNLIFFTPRRPVTIEFAIAPDSLALEKDKLKFNRYLEAWYNAPFEGGEEPVTLRPYYFWSSAAPKLLEKEKKSEIARNAVPPEVRKQIFDELAKISKRSSSDIHEQLSLSRDLGLDSLDLLALAAFLDSDFDVKEIRPEALTTVDDVLQLAISKETQEEAEEIKDNISSWPKENRPPCMIPEGNTLMEVFLRTCDKFGTMAACADELSGVLSYRKLKMVSLLLSKKIAMLPGERIGILLPASVGSTALMIACLLANKVPVLMNWTLGPRQMQDVTEAAQLKCIVSSEKFLCKAKNMDLEGIEEKVIRLETLRSELTLMDKLRAIYFSFLSAEKLLDHLQLNRVDADSPAVFLFTSGTESKPKGVPLSHHNILSNQRAALSCVFIGPSDVMYGFLPPFHSFGFTVTGLLPIFAGIRVVYSPDPTDGTRLARGVAKWGVTIICGAPTFIKNLIRGARPGMLKTVRLFVTGAEKTPEALFEQVNVLEQNVEIIEGYGITECSPILTLNRPGKEKRGVGEPLPGIELKIVHHETLKPLPIGENGLVLASGPNIFNGYLSGGIDPFIEMDGKRWYKTGDLGYLDEKGCLVLSGRMKRFIKIGGEMVNLNALEEALSQSLGAKGMALYDDGPTVAITAEEIEGEKPKVILFCTCSLTVSEANQILKAAGFSNIAKITEIRVVPDLPLLGTGKVNYRALLTLYPS